MAGSTSAVAPSVHFHCDGQIHQNGVSSFVAQFDFRQNFIKHLHQRAFYWPNLKQTRRLAFTS